MRFFEDSETCFLFSRISTNLMKEGESNMLWLLILSPVLILSALAIYFSRKSGMTLPEDSKQDEQSGFLSGSGTTMNSYGPPN